MVTLLSTVPELYCAYCASVYFISFSHGYSAILAAKLMIKLDLTKLDLTQSYRQKLSGTFSRTRRSSQILVHRPQNHGVNLSSDRPLFQCINEIYCGVCFSEEQ